MDDLLVEQRLPDGDGTSADRKTALMGMRGKAIEEPSVDMHKGGGLGRRKELMNPNLLAGEG